MLHGKCENVNLFVTFVWVELQQLLIWKYL